MSVEVEIKARVADLDRLRRVLGDSGRLVRSYDKRDRYYSSDGTVAGARFRLRADEARSVCTFKRKQISDGIEQNDEHEFSLDNAGEFNRFAEYLGYRCVIEKVKRGEEWQVDGVTCELSEVPPLGSFIELELVLGDNPDPAELRSARGRLTALLERLGVDRSTIEERPYTEMLDEVRRTNAADPRPAL